jgi:hypothetical protein
MKPFILRFQELIEKQGYGSSITKFVNSWMLDGGTFKTLHEWIILRNLEVEYITIFINLKKFLTIPYSLKEHY